MTVRERLFALRDEKYGDFSAKLNPTLPRECFIGVRNPAVRALAKELRGTDEAEAFLRDLPHRYFDENNLHAALIDGMKDYSACIAALDEFLPFVDNWATCDMMTPKVFKKHLDELVPEIRRWIGSGETYTVRFGIEMLMAFYLDGAFRPEYLKEVSVIQSKEYYVNMMIAWYFATALAKQYDAAIPYVEQNRLDAWTHNKTIQKAVESFRISDEQKAYLRTLKVR